MMFKAIENLIDGIDLNITVRKSGNDMVVSVLPKHNGVKDGAKDFITPLVIKGTAEELDAQFVEVLVKGLPKVTGVLSNIKEFEEAAGRTAAASDAMKAQREAEAKAKKEKKDKLDGLIKKGDDAKAAGKYIEAIQIYQDAKEFAENPVDLDKKITEVRTLMQPTLF